MSEIMKWFGQYGWAIPAILVAPYLGAKITNGFRSVYRAFFGRTLKFRHKLWRWCLYNFVHFFSTGTLASMCWWFQFQVLSQVLFVGFSVAVAQTGLLALAFAIIGKFNKDLAEEMREGVESDHTTLKTLMLGRKK